jgi:hypothetical protein
MTNDCACGEGMRPDFDKCDGLLPVIAQDDTAGDVLMLASMNEEGCSYLYYNQLRFPVSTSVYPLGKRTNVSHYQVLSIGLGIRVFFPGLSW